MSGQLDRPRIILDCDPGHDDALAIVAAAAYTDLAGITTVAGNAPLERTTYNARVMRDLLGIDVEVHSGAARPLVAEPRTAALVHGASGLDGAELPAPHRELDSADAVGFIVDTAGDQADTWLVATGPLTNVALALRADPDLGRRLAGISLMGGGRFGNRSAVAEFNIWADPEAAAVVFGYGGPLTMAGLDVTHQFTATPERIARIAATGGLLAATLGSLLAYFSGTYLARTDADAIGGAPMHDVLAVLALSHPELFSVVERHVAVETAGHLTRGMTVIDERDLRERPAPTCQVLQTVDADGAFDALVTAIAAYS